MVQIFISFSGEDAELAEFLSRTLNHIFQGHAEFFASSDGIDPGTIWIDRLKNVIQLADSVLVLLSPRSFDRPWINIETGAFWASGKRIYPLVHGGLKPSDLHRPLSDHQAIDINTTQGIARLIGILATRIGLTSPPQYNASQLSASIALLDQGSMKLIQTWRELAEELSISVTEPPPENLNLFSISTEGHTAGFRIFRNNTVELSGYSNDSMLFTFHSKRALGIKRYLIIEVTNTLGAKSFEYGLFMKVLVNGEVILPYFPYHRHSRDSQFTGKGDGYFPYEISFIDENQPLLLHLVLWRTSADRVRLALRLV